jgi:uncharacterized damage-inducible protein DinB
MSQIPYAHKLNGRDPQQVAAETPARLSAVLSRFTAEQAEDPLAPGKWSLREVLCHLADCEIAWAWRLRQALAEDHLQIQPFDQDRWAAPYAHYTLADARATFFALRQWNLAFLHALPHEARNRPVTHPERGEETLWNLVEIMAGHDLHHLDKLEALHPAP